MSTAQVSALEEAIRQSGEGWLIDWFEPKDQALSHLRATLGRVRQRALEHPLGGDAPDLSEDAVVAECSAIRRKCGGSFRHWAGPGRQTCC